MKSFKEEFPLYSMFFSKKTLLLTGLMSLFLLTAGTAAFAAAAKTPTTPVTGIGVIDMDDIVNNHPGMAKARQQMADLARKKQNEAKAAADKETDNAKKSQAVRNKQMELAQEEQKLMEPIFRDCQQAVREVAAKQKLTLVLNKSVVLIGGVDITQDVIQQLAKKK